MLRLHFGPLVSFLVRNIAYVNATLYANSEMLRIKSGRHPEVSSNPQMIGATSEGIRQAILSNSEVANQLGHWQFRTLVLGSCSYIVWHVIEMWLRT